MRQLLDDILKRLDKLEQEAAKKAATPKPRPKPSFVARKKDKPSK